MSDHSFDPFLNLKLNLNCMEYKPKYILVWMHSPAAAAVKLKVISNKNLPAPI